MSLPLFALPLKLIGGRSLIACPRCVVYNYSLSGKTTANQQFSEPVAQSWLMAAAMNWLNSREHPSPGDHRRDCQQPCRGNP